MFCRSYHDGDIAIGCPLVVRSFAAKPVIMPQPCFFVIANVMHPSDFCVDSASAAVLVACWCFQHVLFSSIAKASMLISFLRRALLVQLVLDADIYLGRPMRPMDLVAVGPCTTEPVCDTLRQTSYKGLIAGVEMKYGDDYHRRWFSNSAAVTLQLNVNFSEWNISLGVTPQVSALSLHLDCCSFLAWRIMACIVTRDHRLQLLSRTAHCPVLSCRLCQNKAV